MPFFISMRLYYELFQKNCTTFFPDNYLTKHVLTPEAATGGVLKNFAKLTGKNLRQSLLFNKVADAACNFIKKETLAQVFPCQFWEIFRNNFLTEHLRVTASLTPTRLVLLI